MIKSILTFLFLALVFGSANAQIGEQYIVASPTVSLRSGEGKSFALVATLSKNDVVQVVNTNKNGWWYVDFKGKKGYLIVQFIKKRSNDGWLPKQYETGDTPTCDQVKAEYDTNLDNHLKVTVNSSTDVMLKLMKKQSDGDVCIRTVFIESGDFTLIKNIPEGKYYLKIAYGNDWREKHIDGKCTGRFIENAQYEIGKERLNYKIVQLSNRVDVPSYSLSLGNRAKEGVDASFNTETISEEEFNK
jgi:hypothetical protein